MTTIFSDRYGGLTVTVGPAAGAVHSAVQTERRVPT